MHRYLYKKDSFAFRGKEWIVYLFIVLSCSFSATSYCGVDCVPGELRSYTTMNSIGLEWDIDGDENHNTVVAVKYRVQGDNGWKQAMPLLRIDYQGYNMLAGSILFLEAGAIYEVTLGLLDPEGGFDNRTITVMTRPVPELPSDGRIFYVIPGNGGGDGLTSNPFKGIKAAQSIAIPGDVFLMHKGDYGEKRVSFNKSGIAEKYIVWKAFGDGDVVFNGIDISASHIWLEGIRNVAEGSGLKTSMKPEDVVISKCTFINCHYCIYLNGGGEGWHIVDNVIVGDTSAASGSLSGEGIELNHTSGHVVGYNRITNVADGISYPDTNVDIFGNDIFDTSDDGIESDYGHTNIRIWGNRLHNTGRGISLQPMNGAPWYFVRNQIVGMTYPLKLRFNPDRFVLVHNTMVGYDYVQKGSADLLLSAYSRNNLWISATGGDVWHTTNEGVSDWRTDLDYDGFDWGKGSRAFKWGRGKVYSDIASFTAAVGVEQHGIRVDKDSCFEEFDIPGPVPNSIPPQFLALTDGCDAIDAGVLLPNINDDYQGHAPDLGAYEFGNPLPHYGPRHLPVRRQVTGKVLGEDIKNAGSKHSNFSIHDIQTKNPSPAMNLNKRTLRMSPDNKESEDLIKQIKSIEDEIATLRIKYFDTHPAIIMRQNRLKELKESLGKQLEDVVADESGKDNKINVSLESAQVDGSTSSVTIIEDDLYAEPDNNLIPDNWKGVPYNPWEKLKQIKANDTLPADEFYFVVLADSKTAGNPRRTEVYKRTLRWILNNLKPIPVMIFEVGDLTGGTGDILSHWRSLHECLTTDGFWDKVAYFPTIGDHDCGGEYYNPPGSKYLAGAFYHEFFYFPSEIRSNAASGRYRHLNERYWAFEYKNSLFVSFDTTGREGMRGGPIYEGKPAQKEWLEKIMSNSNAQHIFLFGEHGAPINYGRDALPLLEQYKATAFFSGHAHNYGRYKESGKVTTYYDNGTAASGAKNLFNDWKVKAEILTNVIGFTLVHVKGNIATTYYYCMDYPDNLINGKSSGDVYNYSFDSFHNMPSQANKFFSGGQELVGWIMDVNVMTSVRNVK